MKRDLTPQRGGIAGLLLVFCLAALIGGLAVDYLASARGGFWIDAQFGAAAAVGAGAAAFALVSARVTRLLFGRRYEAQRGESSAHADA
jgi:hypothetical protein